MRRRVRLDVMLVLVVVIAVSGALLYHESTANSSPASPQSSPRAAVASFAAAYLRLLDGALPGSALPYAAPAIRASAAQQAQIPAPARSGPLKLVSAQTRWVHGAVVAQARIVGSDSRHSYPADLDLAYDGSSWRVVDLVPPDLATILAPPYHPPPVAPPLSSAARVFAVTYANFREGFGGAPSGLPSIRGQIQSATDPLAQTQPTHAPASLTSLAFGPVEGNIVAASATLDDRGSALSFSFNLMRVGAKWQAWSFPETSG